MTEDFMTETFSFWEFVHDMILTPSENPGLV